MPVQYLMLDVCMKYRSYWSGGRRTGDYGRAIMVSSKSCAGDSPSSWKLFEDHGNRSLAEHEKRLNR